MYSLINTVSILDDARSQMRHNSVQSGPFSCEMDTLPSYTLVSGLPTYDDALEQFRLSSSTNHLLINHQTFMKLFGNSQPAAGAAKDKDVHDASSQSYNSDDQSLPRYSDVVVVGGSSGDECGVKGMLNVTNKERSSDPLPSDNIAVSRPTAHRFTCTAVPTLPIELNSKRTTLLRHDRRRASEVPMPQFMRLASIPAFNRPLNMVENSFSLGSLNIINEIRRTNPTLHASSSSGNFETMSGSGSRSNFAHRGSIY